MGNKVRKNEDFKAIADFLKLQKLDFVVKSPRGKGHPYLAITLWDGRIIEHNIAGTPRGSGNPDAARTHLKHELRRHGHQC
ncbi:hypothetical protein [Cereibacter changlensis]|uniref:hypothetical protein n=1 Tax=Cereibacter changlensis TaxID=402884 RepID=UPI0040348710